MNSKGGTLKERRHWVCTISQLSMEGKVSFSILSQCQRQYLLQNEYMDAARLCLVWVRKFKHVRKDGGHKAATDIERVCFLIIDVHDGLLSLCMSRVRARPSLALWKMISRKHIEQLPKGTCKWPLPMVA